MGGATRWSNAQVFSRDEILKVVAEHFGAPAEPTDLDSWAPARRYRLPDGTTFGIIATMTAPFCRTCDRSRLTADGMWYLCLYAQNGDGSARQAPRRCDRRRADGTHRFDVASARGPGRRASTGPGPSRNASEGPAPRDAYSRWVVGYLGGVLLFSSSPSSLVCSFLWGPRAFVSAFADHRGQ